MRAGRIVLCRRLLYRLGKTYETPTFGLTTIRHDDVVIPVVEQVVLERAFGRLLRCGASRRHAARGRARLAAGACRLHDRLGVVAPERDDDHPNTD